MVSNIGINGMALHISPCQAGEFKYLTAAIVHILNVLLVEPDVIVWQKSTQLYHDMTHDLKWNVCTRKVS